LEAEVAYRYNRNKRHDNYVYSTRRGHRDVWAAMVNVLYDINMCWCVQPYVGVGIGYAHVKHQVANFYGYGRNHRSDNSFAWQVIAGLAYPICDNIDLAVEYRFFDTTTRRHEQTLYNHDIGVNLKYYF
jgi:opacity protein-like surface antigen